MPTAQLQTSSFRNFGSTSFAQLIPSVQQYSSDGTVLRMAKFFGLNGWSP